MDGILIGKIF